MKLDCSCRGSSIPTGKPAPGDAVPWRCPLCRRKVCTACEGGAGECEALDAVCDECWAGVGALMSVLVLLEQVRPFRWVTR